MTPRPFKPAVVWLLSLSLLPVPPAVGSAAPIGRSSPQSAFAAQALTQRALMMWHLVTGSGNEVVKRDVGRAHPAYAKPAPAFPSTLGAYSGGDLRVMNDLLRQMRARVRLQLRKRVSDLMADSLLIRLPLQRFLRYPRRDDETLQDIKEAAMRLVGGDRLPPEVESIAIAFVEIPNDKHGRRFIRRVLEPKHGITAISYPGHDGPRSSSGWTIALRREDLTPERLAHEYREIALRQRGLHWILAHNQTVREGFGGDLIPVDERLFRVSETRLQKAVATVLEEIAPDQIARGLEEAGVPFNASLIMKLAEALPPAWEEFVFDDHTMIDIAIDEERASAEEAGVTFNSEDFDDRDVAIELRLDPTEYIERATTAILDAYGIPSEVRPLLARHFEHVHGWRLRIRHAFIERQAATWTGLTLVLERFGLPKVEARRAVRQLARKLGVPLDSNPEALATGEGAAYVDDVGAALGAIAAPSDPPDDPTESLNAIPASPEGQASGRQLFNWVVQIGGHALRRMPEAVRKLEKAHTVKLLFSQACSFVSDQQVIGITMPGPITSQVLATDLVLAMASESGHMFQPEKIARTLEELFDRLTLLAVAFELGPTIYKRHLNGFLRRAKSGQHLWNALRAEGIPPSQFKGGYSDQAKRVIRRLRQDQGLSEEQLRDIAWDFFTEDDTLTRIVRYGAYHRISDALALQMGRLLEPRGFPLTEVLLLLGESIDFSEDQLLDEERFMNRIKELAADREALRERADNAVSAFIYAEWAAEKLQEFVEGGYADSPLAKGPPLEAVSAPGLQQKHEAAITRLLEMSKSEKLQRPLKKPRSFAGSNKSRRLHSPGWVGAACLAVMFFVTTFTPAPTLLRSQGKFSRPLSIAS